MESAYMTDGIGNIFLNQEQIMLFLNCNNKTLQRWREAGQIEYKKICSGTYYYILRADIQ